MKNSISYLLWMGFLIVACHLVDEKKPNILFVISDDQSYPHTSIYGTKWISTPGFDRVAEEGLLFSQAYTTNAKCSPQDPPYLPVGTAGFWRKQPTMFPIFQKNSPLSRRYSKIMAIKPALQEKDGPWGGYEGWKKRNLIGEVYRQKKLDPPATFISNVDYFENFKVFLNERTEDQPFFFWLGGHEPHRAYEYQVGTNKGNKNIDQIDQVPDFWPDSKNIRTDMLDYAFEIEYFDGHLVKIIEELEKRNLLENTLIVVTSDNGMPFPRIKGQVYPFDNRLPLAIRWGKGIKNPGRIIDDYFSFSDFAPTFLDLAGINEENHDMKPFSGKSWDPVFKNLPDTHPREHDHRERTP